MRRLNTPPALIRHFYFEAGLERISIASRPGDDMLPGQQDEISGPNPHRPAGMVTVRTNDSPHVRTSQRFFGSVRLNPPRVRPRLAVVVRPLVLLLATFLSVCEIRAVELNPDLARRSWFELRSDGFLTYSYGPSQEVAKVVGRLEQFRFCYAQLAGAPAVTAPPIVVYAFENDADFKPFKPLYQDQPSNVAGYFLRRTDALVICLALRRDSTNTLETLFHEYTHFLLRKNHFWPVWMSEGMADLYSTLDVQNDSVMMGRPPRHYLRELASEPLVPLAKLFAVTQTSAEYNEREKQGMTYAQSWLLVHYLTLGDNPTYRKRFGDYTRLLREGLGVQEAFTKALGTPLPAMEKELQAYLARGEYKPLAVKARSQPRVAMARRNVSTPEMTFVLGQLLLHLQRTNDARTFFSTAHQLQPNGPFGHEGLGVLAAFEDDATEAISHLEPAIRLGAKSYLAHYWLGRERLAQLKSADGSFRRAPREKAATVQQARASLQEAIRLMPRFAPAHYFLGFLELVQGDDLASAEQHLASAYQMEPDQSGYGLALARAQLRQEKKEQAREILESLSRLAPMPEAKAEAKRMLKQLAP